MKKMWLGRYISLSSVYHSLDSRTKLLMMMVNIVMMIFINDWEQLLVAAGFILIFLRLSAIPILFYIKQAMFLKYMYLFFLVFFSVSEGNHFLVEIGVFHLSLDGLLMGLFYVCKMILFVVMGALLTFTTTPGEIMAGVKGIFKSPLMERFVWMGSLSLRLIPTVLEEVKLIYCAQQSRGLDFSELKFKDKVEKLLAIIIPAISNTVRRLTMMMDAMECRGYIVGEKRTSIYQFHFRLRDGVVLACSILALIIVMVL